MSNQDQIKLIQKKSRVRGKLPRSKLHAFTGVASAPADWQSSRNFGVLVTNDVYRVAVAASRSHSVAL